MPERGEGGVQGAPQGRQAVPLAGADDNHGRGGGRSGQTPLGGTLEARTAGTPGAQSGAQRHFCSPQSAGTAPGTAPGAQPEGGNFRHWRPGF